MRKSTEPYLFKKFKKDGTSYVWWARKRHRGETYYKHLETAVKSLARKRAGEWWDGSHKELVATAWGEKQRVLGDVLDKFSEEHLRTLKPRSADRYESSMVHLGEFFGEMRLEEITSGELKKFEALRTKSGVLAPTIRRDLACLSSVFSFAQEYEWIKDNPIPTFMKGRKKRGLIENEPGSRYLPLDEEEAVLKAADDEMRFRIVFAIDQGLRMTEQLSAKWNDVTFDAATALRAIRARGEIRVVNLKKRGQKPSIRTLPLLDRTYDLLRHAARRHPEVIFPTMYGQPFTTRSSLYDAFQAVVRRAGIPDATWHDLRRTCGCRLLQAYRFQIGEVSAWMGHSTVAVTQKHYAFLTSESLHRAVEKGRENVLDFAPRKTA
jgi:integrase